MYKITRVYEVFVFLFFGMKVGKGEKGVLFGHGLGRVRDRRLAHGTDGRPTFTNYHGRHKSARTLLSLKSPDSEPLNVSHQS